MSGPYTFLTTGSWARHAGTFRLRELGAALIERGVDVAYVLDDVPANHDVGIHEQARVSYVMPATGLRQLTSRRETLRALAPSFVHVLDPAAKPFLALAGTRLPVVGDWDEWPSRRPHAPLRAAAERYLDRWLRRRAVHTVVASRYLQDQLGALHGLDATYIPNAVFEHSYSDGMTPYERPTAVYMGNYYPAYDHDLLFDAAVLLAARGSSARIDFIGDGLDLPQWRAFVDELGLTNVRIMGYLAGKELWRRLRHAHVLLLPIRPTVLNRARCPMKTFSYAQARRPVIANAVGEVPAVLGAAAKYVEPTPEAFADAIEFAFASDRPDDVEFRAGEQSWAKRAETLALALGLTLDSLSPGATRAADRRRLHEAVS